MVKQFSGRPIKDIAAVFLEKSETLDVFAPGVHLPKFISIFPEQLKTVSEFGRQPFLQQSKIRRNAPSLALFAKSKE